MADPIEQDWEAQAREEYAQYLTEMRRSLDVEAGLRDAQSARDEAGILVKETDTHYIYVMRMAYNWRLHTIRKPLEPMSWSERFWCYEGLGQQTFLRAWLAANAWDGADNTEPAGWNKNGQTHEWRG